jgi:transposase-like protein
MEDYPKTLSEFEDRFSTEKGCREYLFQLRWPTGYSCPRCGHKKAWQIGNGLRLCSSCHYKGSVTAGTIFEGTRKPLRLWFRAIWWLTNQKTGISALGIQKVLEFGGYETAWMWLHKLRRAMVRPLRDKLTGKIEVDETYIGGEKHGKRGRGALGKALVMIAAQIDGTRIGRIRLSRITDASAKSLERAIQQAVLPGSIIRTDGWRSYNRLNHLGYKHEIVREEPAVGENLLPSCNRVAALLKRWMMGTHQGAIGHEHLDHYMEEFMFRFNRRTSSTRGKLFYRLLQQAVITEPKSYGKLIMGWKHAKTRNHNILG